MSRPVTIPFPEGLHGDFSGRGKAPPGRQDDPLHSAEAARAFRASLAAISPCAAAANAAGPPALHVIDFSRTRTAA